MRTYQVSMVCLLFYMELNEDWDDATQVVLVIPLGIST